MNLPLLLATAGLALLAGYMQPCHRALQKTRLLANLWRWQMYSDPQSSVTSICHPSLATDAERLPALCTADVAWRQDGGWVSLCAFSEVELENTVSDGSGPRQLERYYRLTIRCSLGLPTLHESLPILSLPLLQTTIFR